MENIDDIGYRHGNNVFKKFKLKNLREYHDLYVKSNTLLLADVLASFRNTCLKVYELDTAHFLSLPGVAWQACLKKTNIKLELLTDYDMLLMVEEGIRGGICHSIHSYARANNKKKILGGKIITEFVTLRPKTYSYLSDDGKEDKKAKGTKKCVIKRIIKFDDYKNCLLNGEVILKSQQRFKSKGHSVYTKNINKIALSSNGDKRIVSSDKIASYPYEYKGKQSTK